jgi:UTP:GlnB (protein PII) uridylyltransferase
MLRSGWQSQHLSGKGSLTEGHIDASLRLVQDPMTRIRMPWQDRDMVMFLIERHLDLSAAMFSRGVFDPLTIRDVAHQVGTVERLKMLTLLTYADIGAVNPMAMTPWRAEQLWQLYLMVYARLFDLRQQIAETAAPGLDRGAEVPEVCSATRVCSSTV